MPIDSEIIDGFWHSRCLNDHIDLLYMMELLTSGATDSLVTKIGTKDLTKSCSVYRMQNNRWILTFKVCKQPYQSLRQDRIICKWCQYLLGGQKWNKNSVPLPWKKSSPVDRFWCLMFRNDHIDFSNMIWSFASDATLFSVNKNRTKKLLQFYR